MSQPPAVVNARATGKSQGIQVRCRVSHAPAEASKPEDLVLGADLLGQARDGFTRGDVDLVLIGDDRGPGVARGDGQLLHLGVLAQRE